MKSKHCIYGKKAVYSCFDSYHTIDDLHNKSTITAYAKTVIII